MNTLSGTPDPCPRTCRFVVAAQFFGSTQHDAYLPAAAERVEARAFVQPLQRLHEQGLGSSHNA